MSEIKELEKQIYANISQIEITLSKINLKKENETLHETLSTVSI